MLKQDYILRLIKQLAEVFGRLLQRLRNVGPAQVEEEIDRALRDFSGLSIDLINTLSLRGLLEVLRSGEQSDVARSLAVAELLYLHAATRLAQGDEAGALSARIRSLTLYLDTLPSLPLDGLDEPRSRADELIDALHDEDLPEETLPRLLPYSEASGYIARGFLRASPVARQQHPGGRQPAPR